MTDSLAENERRVEILPLAGARPNPEDEDMFSVHCPTHESEVLLSERRIRALRPTTAGLEIDYECWCGTRGSMRTGRAMAGRHRPVR